MAFGYRYRRLNKNNSNNTPISSINITPFVDIILVLLIIFMVTSPMLNNGFDVNLPKVDSSKITINQDQQLIFSVDKNRQIRIDTAKITLSQVSKILRKYNKQSTQVFIKGDKDADYGAIMDLMGEIHKNGFNNISLVTDVLKK